MALGSRSENSPSIDNPYKKLIMSVNDFISSQRRFFNTMQQLSGNLNALADITKLDKKDAATLQTLLHPYSLLVTNPFEKIPELHPSSSLPEITEKITNIMDVMDQEEFRQLLEKLGKNFLQFRAFENFAVGIKTLNTNLFKGAIAQPKKTLTDYPMLLKNLVERLARANFSDCELLDENEFKAKAEAVDDKGKFKKNTYIVTREIDPETNNPQLKLYYANENKQLEPVAVEQVPGLDAVFEKFQNNKNIFYLDDEAPGKLTSAVLSKLAGYHSTTDRLKIPDLQRPMERLLEQLKAMDLIGRQLNQKQAENDLVSVYDVVGKITHELRVAQKEKIDTFDVNQREMFVKFYEKIGEGINALNRSKDKTIEAAITIFYPELMQAYLEACVLDLHQEKGHHSLSLIREIVFNVENALKASGDKSIIFSDKEELLAKDKGAVLDSKILGSVQKAKPSVRENLVRYLFDCVNESLADKATPENQTVFVNSMRTLSYMGPAAIQVWNRICETEYFDLTVDPREREFIKDKKYLSEFFNKLVLLEKTEPERTAGLMQEISNANQKASKEAKTNIPNLILQILEFQNNPRENQAILHQQLTETLILDFFSLYLNERTRKSFMGVGKTVEEPPLVAFQEMIVKINEAFAAQGRKLVLIDDVSVFKNRDHMAVKILDGLASSPQNVQQHYLQQLFSLMLHELALAKHKEKQTQIVGNTWKLVKMLGIQAKKDWTALCAKHNLAMLGIPEKYYERDFKEDKIDKYVERIFPEMEKQINTIRAAALANPPRPDILGMRVEKSRAASVIQSPKTAYDPRQFRSSSVIVSGSSQDASAIPVEEHKNSSPSPKQGKYSSDSDS